MPYCSKDHTTEVQFEMQPRQGLLRSSSGSPIRLVFLSVIICFNVALISLRNRDRNFALRCCSTRSALRFPSYKVGFLMVFVVSVYVCVCQIVCDSTYVYMHRQ